jgi:hypothetical protein
MAKARPLTLGPDERFDLTVREEGILPLPEPVVVALRLQSGELVSMERWPGSLYLETFTAFLDALEETAPSGKHWSEVVRVFLSRALLVVAGSGLELPIPADLFPLRPGDRVVLQVIYRGPFPELYLYPADLRPLHEALTLEFNRKEAPRW